MGKIEELVRKELQALSEEQIKQIEEEVLKTDFPRTGEEIVEIIVPMISETVRKSVIDKYFYENFHDGLCESVNKYVEDWAKKKLEDKDFLEMFIKLAEKVREAVYAGLPEFLEEECAKLVLKEEKAAE